MEAEHPCSVERVVRTLLSLSVPGPEQGVGFFHAGTNPSMALNANHLPIHQDCSFQSYAGWVHAKGALATLQLDVPEDPHEVISKPITYDLVGQTQDEFFFCTCMERAHFFLLSRNPLIGALSLDSDSMPTSSATNRYQVSYYIIHLLH